MTNEKSIIITDNFEKKEYDDFVYSNPNTSVFQTSEIAEIYKKNVDTEPLILVALDENSGEVLASLLAKKVKRKQGFLSSFSLYSTIRGGPLFKNTEDGINAVSLLLQEYNNRARKWGPIFTRIYPLNNTPQIFPAFKLCGYEYQDWQNYLLQIDRPINEIWRQINKRRRYGINTAKKRNVSIEEIKDKYLLPVFYRLLQETFRNRESPLEDISNFEATFDILVPKNMARFFMAKHDGKFIAAILLLLYKNVAYEWYIGSSKNPKDLSMYPNDLLLWHAIEFCSKNGFHIFDFGGGGLPKDADAGWVKFKKEFSGNLVNYGRYTKIHQPKKLWIAERGFDIYKRIKFYKK